MLEIIASTLVPNGTYSNRDEHQPYFDEDGNLVIKGGEGERRSWGTPKTTSTIVLHAEDLVAIHIAYVHKRYGDNVGGQFWRYYAPDSEGVWCQVEWRRLSDTDRDRILVAREDRAPGWAHIPGKLRSEYNRPSQNIRTTYKIVRIEDERLFSVHDADTEYVLGKRLCERAVEEHGGGYYSYPTEEDLMTLFERGKLFNRRDYEQIEHCELAVIECEISGNTIQYGSKIASTYIRPIQILETFNYTPMQQEAM